MILAVPLLLLGIAAGRKAADEAGVRAWQLEQASTATDPKDRADFTEYAASTLGRQQEAERSRNQQLIIAVIGMGGGLVLLLTAGRRPEPAKAAAPAEAAALAGAAVLAGATASAGPPAPQTAPTQPQFRPCEACQWQISVAATMCPRCGHPNTPPATAVAAEPSAPPLPVNKLQRAFYIVLLIAGVGSAVVIYTVLFDTLSETELTHITPYWIFPAVFGYYGLVAQRMEARLPTSHLDNVSDQLLNVIKEIGPLGQALAFLVHAPFLIVKNQRPWVVAFAGSLIWAMALTIFFEVVFPQL